MKEKDKQINIRLSQRELTLLQSQAEEHNMNSSRYIRHLLDREEKAKRGELSKSGQHITLYRESDLGKIIWHLAHWGNNLNQAANALNRIATNKIFSDSKKEEILKKAAKNIDDTAKAAKILENTAYEIKEDSHIVVDG